MINDTTIYINATKPFDFSNFENYDFELNEIVQSLANQCRFNGHISKYYSVLQHCMFTYEIAKIFYPDNKLIQQHSLIHDFHEAYVSDIVTPLANFLCKDKINSLKENIDNKIFKKLNLPELSGENKCKVKICDTIAYEVESTLLGNLFYVKTDLKDKDSLIIKSFEDLQDLGINNSVFRFYWKYEGKLK